MDKIKYTFTPEKGKIFDFFFILNKLFDYNFSCVDNVTVTPDNLNNEISKFCKEIINTLKIDTSDFSLFFKSDENGNNLFTSLINDNFVEAETIEETLNTFRAYDLKEIILKTFLFFDKRNNFSEKFYNIIIQNRELLVEYLNGLKLSFEIKWGIINLIDIGESIKEGLYRFLYKLSQFFEAEYGSDKNIIDEQYDEVKLKFNDYTALNNESENEIKYALNRYKTINICVSMFLTTAVRYLFSKNNILNVYLGSEFYKSLQPGSCEIFNNTELFKAFSDITRVKIVDLIKKEKLSAGEIAERLEINASTLSHHLDILCESNIIAREICGKKSFFNINKKHILEIIRQFKHFAE
jgi:ArsR family transcriptional regulator